MPKIIPFLWFDHQAQEAAKFYVELFGENAKIINTYEVKGKVKIINLDIFSQRFTLINSGTGREKIRSRRQCRRA